MSSEWITGKSSVGWSRFLIGAAIVAGCSGGSDATDPPNQSQFNQGGFGGWDPGQGGQGAIPQQQQIPPPGPLCGNGRLDQGEQCEGGTALTCAQATMGSRPNGTVVCTNCYIDMNGCVPQYNPPPGQGGAPPGGGGTAGQLGNPPPGGGAPPVGGAPGTGGATPIPPGSKDPAVPQVSGSCPNFANGAWSFMGKTGQMAVGTKPGGPTAPMLFYWHGTGSSAAEGMSGAIKDGVVQEGGVVVSFQGMSGGGDITRSGTAIFDTTYYPVADQFYACAIQDRNVDPRRAFTTGCSAGGLMATSMAVDRSGYIAAAGPNSGGMISTTLPWQNDHTPGLMTVHGKTGTDVVIIDFANSSNQADTVFKGRGGFVIDCDTGGGHCGGAALFPAVWQFFKAHPFGVDPSPWAGGLPGGFPSQCKIF